MLFSQTATVVVLAFQPLLYPLRGAAATESTSDNTTYDISCPPEDVSLTMAGPGAGNRLVEAWQQAYSTEYCPGFNITFQTNSWDSGAARVCASSLIYDPVDIASMGGTFFQPQATTADGWNYHCTRSKLARETVLLHVAQKGMSVGVKKEGIAASCLQLLGGGLSRDQLRWIYSTFNKKQLIANGWNPTSVPFEDDDDSTHLWSELNENCTAAEIILGAPHAKVGTKGGAIDFFHEHILSSRNENMREHYTGLTEQEQDNFLHANGAAITFSHLYDMISSSYQQKNLLAVGITDTEGTVTMPSAKAYETGSYPFLEKVFIGLVNEPSALELTRPFLEFGLSAEGTQILMSIGYWPLRKWEKVSMYTRLGSMLGLKVEEIRDECGPVDGDLIIGGSDTVLPVLHVWSEIYHLGCPMNIELEGGGSSAGAFRVCASSESGDAVDVGMMSRDFDPEDEAIPRRKNKFVYDCIMEEDEESRSVVQIDVALDGITVMYTLGSIGEQCVSLLGGLTMDQLRWMYSSYNDEQLQNSGWDPKCLKNNDFDSSTHKWSELDARCSDEEIQLVGDYWNDGSFTSISKQIFNDYYKGEHIANNRPKPYVEAYGFDALRYLVEHDDAVSYVGYHYYFEHQDVYWAAPIARTVDGPFVKPLEDTIADGSYPLVRSIYINLHNDAAALRDVVPLIKFGFSRPDLIFSSGYVPITGEHLQEMLLRLDGAPYSLDGKTLDEESTTQVGVILGSIAAAIVVIVLTVLAVYCLRK